MWVALPQAFLVLWTPQSLLRVRFLVLHRLPALRRSSQDTLEHLARVEFLTTPTLILRIISSSLHRKDTLRRVIRLRDILRKATQLKLATRSKDTRPKVSTAATRAIRLKDKGIHLKEAILVSTRRKVTRLKVRATPHRATHRRGTAVRLQATLATAAR